MLSLTLIFKEGLSRETFLFESIVTTHLDLNIPYFRMQ